MKDEWLEAGFMCCTAVVLVCIGMILLGVLAAAGGCPRC